jgi:hypothetical protein
VGGWRFSRAWANPAWQRFIEATPDIPIAESAGARGGTLYLARRRVMDGGMLYVAAEGYGREAFRIALPGCVARIRSGWLVLRRQSDVPVLPVLSHLEGMTQVVTIQPPLPAPSRDLARDLDACRDVIATLLGDYVRRFPEQCYGYAFPPRVAARVEESSPLESRAALPVPGPARRPSEAIDG